MALYTRVASSMIIYMAKERWCGRVLLKHNMIIHMRAIEIITKCMVKAYIFGLMGENMKGNIVRIKNMGMGSLRGRMEGCLKGIGKTGSKMVEVLSRKREKKKGKAFGKMVSW